MQIPPKTRGQLVQDLPPYRRMNRTGSGRNSSSSSTTSSIVPTGRSFAAFRTHRRMSSYPEAVLAARRREKRIEQSAAAGIELQTMPKTSAPTQLQPSTSQRPTTAQAAPKPKGHRRIASVGAIVRTGADTALTSITTTSEMANVIEGQDQPQQLAENTRPSTRGLLHPSVTFAASPSPDPGAVAENDEEERKEDSLITHEETDDYDDDDIDIQNHINPLQLLNQAMEYGMRSAARQYRRRNMAAHQRVSTVTDPATGPSGLPTENGGADGEMAVSAKQSVASLRPRPPLSKQTTVDGTRGGAVAEGLVSSIAVPSTGVPSREDPLASTKVSNFGSLSHSILFC